MNCPTCNSKVKSNSEYSIHMNLKHRGKSYKDLYEAKENKKYESNTRKSKTNVDYRMEE
jgi:hypothetical protein